MNTKLLIQGLALTSMFVGSQLTHAAIYNLCAGVTTKTMPDAVIVTMWGFGLDTAPPTCNATVPGPALTVPPGDTSLTINLRNTLPVATSVMIPGLSSSTPPAPVFFTDPQGRQRARALTHEAPINGAITSYTFNASPGTYLYQTGSHPAVQMQMGLYGSVTQDAAAGQAYPGVNYNNEIILLYSEIDPALHSAVSSNTYGTAAYPSTINYIPKYFLVNGEAFTPSTPDISAGTVGEKTLIRLLNAGLKSHVPMLQEQKMEILAEYGSPYPFSRTEYSPLLAAGQTKDAVFTPVTAGRYALYDRSLRLTNNLQSKGGLMSFLSVAPAPGTPVATPDIATTNEDTALTALDLATNDTDDVSKDLTSIDIVFPPDNGTVSVNTGAGAGTVSYTPNANYFGADSFSYTISDNTGNVSNLTDVSITVNSVNDAPVAADDNFNVISGSTLNVAASGILNNDTDVELDALTAQLQTNVTAGSLTLNPDGSFSYTPNIGTTIDTFTYLVSDTAPSNSNVATVTINVDSIPPPTTAATLGTPSGSSSTNPPTYNWSPVADADDYYLWVVNIATGNPISPQWYTAAQAGCDAGQPNCSITASSALTDGQYRWMIISRNTGGNGPLSLFNTFSIGATPGAAAPIAPTGNISPDNMPTYSWSAVANATDYYLWVVDIATGSPLSPQWYSAAQAGCNAGQTSCSIAATTALNDGQYRWMILTRNLAGNGPWSPVTYFAVGNVPGAAFALTPTGNIAPDNVPVYSWNAAPGASEYLLWVVDTSTGLPISPQWYSANLAGCGSGEPVCSITPPGALASGKQYRWMVLSRNISGNGPWSNVRLFDL